MTRSADTRLGAYAGLAAAGLVAALALRQAELAIVAAPFAALVALGVRSPAPTILAWFEIERERALEGDELDATLTVRSPSGADRVEVGLALPTGLELEGRSPIALHLAPGEERELPLRLRCIRWAPLEVGDIRLRARGRIGLVRHEGRIDRRRPLKVYPTPEHSGSSSLPPTRRPRPAARSRGYARKGSSSPTRGRSCAATGSAR